MICFGGRATFIVLAGVLAYWRLHRIVNALVKDMGIALGLTILVMIACLFVAAMVAVIGRIQRRRAKQGACTTCPFKCQQALIPEARVMERVR